MVVGQRKKTDTIWVKAFFLDAFVDSLDCPQERGRDIFTKVFFGCMINSVALFLQTFEYKGPI